MTLTLKHTITSAQEAVDYFRLWHKGMEARAHRAAQNAGTNRDQHAFLASAAAHREAIAFLDSLTAEDPRLQGEVETLRGKEDK